MHRTTEGPRRRSPQNHDRRSPTWTQFVARLIDDELPNRRLRDHRAGMASPRFLRAPCVRAPRAARRRGRLRRVRGRVRVQPRAHRAAGCAAEARGGRRGCGCRLGGPRDRPGARAVPHAVRGLRLVGARAEAGGRPAPPGGGWRGGRRRGHRLRRLGEGVLRQDQLPDRQAARGRDGFRVRRVAVRARVRARGGGVRVAGEQSPFRERLRQAAGDVRGDRLARHARRGVRRVPREQKRRPDLQRGQQLRQRVHPYRHGRDPGEGLPATFRARHAAFNEHDHDPERVGFFGAGGRRDARAARRKFRV